MTGGAGRKRLPQPTFAGSGGWCHQRSLIVFAEEADEDVVMAIALRNEKAPNMGTALRVWRGRKHTPLVHDSTGAYVQAKSTI